MNIDPELLKALTVFLIPGIIIESLIRFVSSNRVDTSIYRFLYLSAFSLINYAIWGYFIDLIASSFYAYCLVSAITGIATGIIIITIMSSDVFIKLFHKIGFVPRSPLPTAWEWLFKQGQGFYVVVYLKSGESFRGVIGPNSYVSDDIEHLDIFIEKLYNYSKTDGWTPIDGSGGVYIPYSEIQAMEFYK